MATLFDPLDVLTPRQLHIVRLAYADQTRAAISTQLGIAARTLEWHTTQIRQVLPHFRLPKSTPLRLTAREWEIAQLVAKGLSNEAIALHLKIEVTTVRCHLNRLYRKTGIESRVHLTRTILIVQNKVLIGVSEAA